MLKWLEDLASAKIFLTKLTSIDNSLKIIAQTHQDLFKLLCIKWDYDPNAVREATYDNEIAGSPPTLLNQTDDELAELSKIFDQFKEIMGREPYPDENLDTVKKIARKEPL